MGTHSRVESLESERNPAVVSGHLVQLGAGEAWIGWSQVEEVAKLQDCVRNRTTQ